MKRLFITAVLLTVFIDLYAQTTKQIIGYYPNWRRYSRNGLGKPENLDYKKYTILNYSFFNLDREGNILSSDPQGDRMNLEEYPSLVDLAHRAGTKVLPSIGGWTFSSDFSFVARDSIKRIRFARNCVDLVKKYNFDGIDIDWEYPTYDGHNGIPEDTKNFNLMLAEIRKALDDYGDSVNYKFLLTAALPSTEYMMKNLDWPEIIKSLDYCNVMTYDYDGPWTPMAGHNAPLYSCDSQQISVDYTYHMLIDEYKVPKEQINLGAAFYGRSVYFPDGDAEIFGKDIGKGDVNTWPEYEGMPQFWGIGPVLDEWDQYWDDICKVPYLIKKDSTAFLSYDNERSMKLKAEYFMEKDVAGVIIWEITGDFIEAAPGTGMLGKTPLVDILNEVMNKDAPKRERIKKKKL